MIFVHALESFQVLSFLEEPEELFDGALSATGLLFEDGPDERDGCNLGGDLAVVDAESVCWLEVVKECDFCIDAPESVTEELDLVDALERVFV